MKRYSRKEEFLMNCRQMLAACSHLGGSNGPGHDLAEEFDPEIASLYQEFKDLRAKVVRVLSRKLEVK